MKQLIVLISTIILGVSLSGVVMGLGGNVGDIAKATSGVIGQNIGWETTTPGAITVPNMLDSATN